MARTPSESESDTNLSPQRRAWAEKNLDPEARRRCSPRTRNISCASRSRRLPQRHREGRRHLDRGHRRPPLHGFPRQQRAPHRLRASAAEARDRRADGRAAVRAAPLHLRAGGRARRASSPRSRPATSRKVLFTTGGSDAVEVAIKIARAATGRYKTLSFWDAFHGAGFGAAAVGGEALFRSGGVGPLMPGAEHVAPYAAYRCPYGTSTIGASADACARMIEYVLEREGRHRGLHRRADARGAAHSAARLLAPRAHRLRPARHAADLRRDPDRARQDRQDVRCAARRRGAGPDGARQGARRRHRADRRGDRAARARRRRGLRVRPLHAREEPGDDARRAHHDPDHRGGGSGRERRQGRRLRDGAAATR